ncbi:MAG: asparagine synthase-related protein [Polyangiaceae bacterium]
MGGIALELWTGPDTAARGAPVAVAAMLRAMRSRGRDGARLAQLGDARGPSCVLGYASTWLTAEDDGTEQPRLDRGDALAFDGRIDDRVGLALELGERSDLPDAALALAALRRFGLSAAKRVRGEFAFAWRDAAGRVLAAADRLGAVPLYYRCDDVEPRGAPLGGKPQPIRRIRVASEKQALFADVPAPRIHRAELALALAEDYPEREATLYEGIFAIPPGHQLVVDEGRAWIERYWSLDATRALAVRDARDASAWLRSELTAAVRDRMRARGGRVASTVSGGLDSTTIAALATRIARDRGDAPPLLVTIRYPDPATDETELARVLARHLGSPLHVHDVPRGPGSFPVPNGVETLWDPYMTLVERMSSTLRDHGCSALTLGFGGDEVQRNTGFEVDECLQHVDPLGAVRWAGPMKERWAVRRLVSTGVRRLIGPIRRPSPGRPPAFLVPEARADVERAQEERRIRLDERTIGSAKRVLVESFVEGQAAPYGLSHSAHTAAALGLAFLQPFFDVRVIELLLALPLSVRPDPFSHKPLLRRITEEVAPPALSRRFERANFMPFYRMVLRENAAALRELLGAERLAAEGQVQPGEALRTFETALANDHAVRDAMTLVTYEGWLAALENRAPEPTSWVEPPVNGSGGTCIVW